VPTVRRPDAGSDPALFAAALVTAAHTACWVDIDAARRLAEQAVEVTRQLGDDRQLRSGRNRWSEPAASATTSC
jgi:hypothetical protein